MRADAEQVVGPADFAGGVAGDGQRQVVGVNPRAVVGDADQLGPPFEDVDFDAGGERIEAVFQQLLDDAPRTLDHFAGGNLIDDEGLERLNPRHVTGRLMVSGQSGPAEDRGRGQSLLSRGSRKHFVRRVRGTSDK